MKCGTLVGSIDGLYQVVKDETIVAASNVITNPGFETGNVSPWQKTTGFATNLTVSATRHSGNHGGNCTLGESAPQRVYQNLVAYKSSMQGRTCTFKLWIKSSYRTVPALRIYVQSNYGNSSQSSLINGDDAWHQHTISFVGNFDVGGTTTFINVGIVADVDNVYPVYIDDAELIISPGVTQIQTTGLLGDTDNHYKIIGYLVGNGTADYKLRLNNDLGTNYGHQEFKMIQSPLGYSAQRVENDTGILIGNCSTGQSCFFEADIYARSGNERTALIQSTSGVSGTTIGSYRSIAGVYGVLSPEVTSLEVTSSPNYGIGLGSRIVVFRKVELEEGIEIGSIEYPADIKGVWKLVEKVVLTSTQLGHTFSGLSGNTDVVYRLITYNGNDLGNPHRTMLTVSPGAGSYATIDTHYSTQGGTVFYSEAMADTLSLVSRDRNGNEWAMSDTIIYAPTGSTRIAISKYVYGFEPGTGLLYGQGYSTGVWSNTSTNITALAVSGTGSFKSGTVFELWKLNIG